MAKTELLEQEIIEDMRDYLITWANTHNSYGALRKFKKFFENADRVVINYQKQYAIAYKKNDEPYEIDFNVREYQILAEPFGLALEFIGLKK